MRQPVAIIGWGINGMTTALCKSVVSTAALEG